MEMLPQKQELEIVVRDKTNYEIGVAVFPHTLVAELIEVLQNEAPNHFPSKDSQGRPVYLRLHNTRTNMFLHPDAEIQEANVQHGDLLLALPKFLNAQAWPT